MEPLLEVENLLVNPSAHVTIPEVSFTLESSSAIWITGPSGSGKTTLLKTLARLLLPAGGNIRLRGSSSREIPATRWRSRVLYLHQKAVMFHGTVLSNLSRAFTLSLRRSQEPDMETARAHLTRLLLPEEILQRDALVISVGEALRVALVRALLLDPDVLLLDEPTAALDPDSRAATADLLREWISSPKRGIVGVTHDEFLRRLLPGHEVRL